MKRTKMATAALLAAWGAAAAGCGGEPATTEWCESNADCDPGYYCDPQTALCAQDCVTDGDCTGELVCDQYGQCVEEQDTSSGDTDPCGDPVLMVIDRSQSMDTNGTWDVLVAAAEAAISAFDEGIDFGLLVFPDDSCVDNYSGTDLDKLCRGPDNTTVDIGPSAATSIHDSLESLGTCGGTPTSAALSKAAQLLDLYGGNAQVVLITDGLPNCNVSLSGDDCDCLLEPPQSCEGAPEHCLDLELAKERAAEILGQGSAVHVLTMGMGEEQQGLMDELAAAGGTEAAIICADGPDLDAGLTAIFTTITDC